MENQVLDDSKYSCPFCNTDLTQSSLYCRQLHIESCFKESNEESSKREVNNFLKNFNNQTTLSSNSKARKNTENPRGKIAKNRTKAKKIKKIKIEKEDLPAQITPVTCREEIKINLLNHISIQPSNLKNKQINSKKIWNDSKSANDKYNITYDSFKVIFDDKIFSKEIKKFYLSLINNEINSDLNIKCRGGNIIKAHKIIVLSRCPLLQDLIDNSNKIDLETFSAQIITVILKYAYAGIIEFFIDDFLQLLDLASICGCESLIEYLNEINENQINKTSEDFGNFHQKIGKTEINTEHAQNNTDITFFNKSETSATHPDNSNLIPSSKILDSNPIVSENSSKNDQSPYIEHRELSQKFDIFSEIRNENYETPIFGNNAETTENKNILLLNCKKINADDLNNSNLSESHSNKISAKIHNVHDYLSIENVKKSQIEESVKIPGITGKNLNESVITITDNEPEIETNSIIAKNNENLLKNIVDISVIENENFLISFNNDDDLIDYYYNIPIEEQKINDSFSLNSGKKSLPKPTISNKIDEKYENNSNTKSTRENTNFSINLYKNTGYKKKSIIDDNYRCKVLKNEVRDVSSVDSDVKNDLNTQNTKINENLKNESYNFGGEYFTPYETTDKKFSHKNTNFDFNLDDISYNAGSAYKLSYPKDLNFDSINNLQDISNDKNNNFSYKEFTENIDSKNKFIDSNFLSSHINDNVDNILINTNTNSVDLCKNGPNKKISPSKIENVGDVIPSQIENKKSKVHTMDTPTLKNEIKKYGLKPMSKNKMITILAEIDQKVSNCDNIEPVVDVPKGNRPISSTDIDDKMLISLLRADKNILRQIISFETLDVKDLQAFFKSKNININKKRLTSFLNSQSITYQPKKKNKD